MNRLFITITLCLAAGCATPSDPERRVRKFDVGDYAPKADRAPGSLFRTVGLLEDERPSRIGDVIIVRIQESDSALHDSSTVLDRSSSFDVGISGAIDKAIPQVGMADLFGMETGQGMEGKGRVSRKGQLKGMLPVRVKQVLPNGDLYVEGTKIVSVGNEARHLYVSGVVRIADVLGDGSVLSSRIADAEISYIGEGDLTDQQEVGWLTRVLSYIWPF